MSKNIFHKNEDVPLAISHSAVNLIDKTTLAINQFFSKKPTHILVSHYRAHGYAPYSHIDFWNDQQATRILMYLTDELSNSLEGMEENLNTGRIEFGFIDQVDIFYFTNEIINRFPFKNYSISNEGVTYY